jgi:disulfide bond formation protein DsbB
MSGAGVSTTSPSQTGLFLAWLVALAATLGALFIGEVMGQAPCTLCWFQRVCMFPLAVILGVAAFRGDGNVWRYGLPLAVVGLVIAAYHSLLYAGVIEEALQPCSASGPSCSGEDMTLFEVVPIPYLAVASFALIAVALLFARRKATP